MQTPSFKSLSTLAQRAKQPLARDKADTLLLLIACALVLAPHAAHLPLWTSLACSALLLWRGWITFSGSRMPPRWLLLPVAIIAMASVYAEYRTFLGREAGVTMLVNQQHRLPPPHDDVVVLGLDEPWTGAPDGTPLHSDAAVRIGLAHGPDGYDHLARAAPDLLLCGHTHGGQVCLPGGRPLTVPGQRSRQWPHGVHEHQGTCIVVSRGIGGVEIPVRLFAPPDVVWVTVG